MDRDLNELKSHWQNMSQPRTDGSSHSELTPSLRSHGLSAMQRMLRFYNVLTVVAAVWIFLGPLVMYQAHMPLMLCVCYAIYFGVMTGLCIDTRSMIAEINVGEMTTVALLEHVISLQRKRSIYQFIGVSMMLPLLAWTLFCFRVNEAMLIGGISGAIFGLIIGLINDYKMRRTLSRLRAELESVTAAS